MNMLSGAEEGAQGAPFESYKLAAVRLAEAVRLASRGNDSENDMVLELSGAVNLFLRETGIALAFGNALENLEGVAEPRVNHAQQRRPVRPSEHLRELRRQRCYCAADRGWAGGRFA